MDKVSLENKHDQQIPWCSSSTKHIYDSQGQGSLICNVTSLLLAYNFCPVKLTKTSLPSDTIFNSLANRKLWFYQAFDYKKRTRTSICVIPPFSFNRKFFHTVKQTIIRGLFGKSTREIQHLKVIVYTVTSGFCELMKACELL